MSFYDDASLIMYPSGYKEDKIYSLKPTNGTGDLTFSRASSATRVNAEGLIEEVPVNFLQQSNTFTTIWDDNYVTLTSGQSGYDGTNDGWLLTGFAGTSEKRIRQNPAKTGINTLSVYAKAGTEDFLWLRGVTNSANVRVFYNLSNGTIANAGSAISSAITDVGNGWYRCEATIDQQAGFEFYIGISDSASASTSTTGNIYIQDAQLNSGSTAKTYFPTTDRLNVPRIDYSNGCGSLLLEKQSTNLITYSEDFSNAAWIKTDITITSNNATSPDGTQNADKLTEGTATASRHGLYQNVSGTANVSKTLSCFVKKNIGDFVQLSFNDSQPDNWVAIVANLSTGQIVDTASAATATYENSKIESFENGWYRISVTGKYNTATYHSKILTCDSASPTRDNYGNAFFNGNGTRSFYIYGAQLEESSYPTSYIISNSGSTTTRLADTASKTGISSLINDSEGVLYAEIAALNNDLTNRFMCLSDGSNDNRVLVGYRAISNQLFSRIEANNSASIDLTHVLTDSTEVIKFAIKYDSSFNYKMFVNGVLVDSGVGTDSIIGLDRIDFTNATGTENFYGNVQNLMVFPSVLTDDELADLTGAVHQTFNSLATFYGYTIL